MRPTGRKTWTGLWGTVHDDAFVIRLICLLLCRVLAPTLDFRFDLFTWFGFLKKGSGISEILG